MRGLWRGMLGMLVGLLVAQSAAAGLEETSIPDLVQRIPLWPAEVAFAERDLFTLVATNVPVDELLTTLSKKAGLGLDLAATPAGTVSLTLTDRPLSDVLEQIGRQTGLRFRVSENNVLTVLPDALQARGERGGAKPGNGWVAP